MHDIDILDKKELEKEFAKDFSSPIFPILGELYLKNKDLNRARKVCEIGLEHDPENINGYYILAKIHLHNNELKKAESLLVKIIDKKPLHINALRLIVQLHEELNLSKKHKLKYLKKICNIFPNDKNFETKINNLSNEPLNEDNIEFNNNRAPINKDPIGMNINFNIQSSMATLTFVEILKEQKHYHEALHVLSLIESKSQGSKKTKKLKVELQKLLTEV